MTEESKNALMDAMAENLGMLRARLDLTQAQLAEMVGIGRQTYLLIENKKRKMTWNTFLSFLIVFTKNKETDQLLNVIGIYTEELNDYLKRRLS